MPEIVRVMPIQLFNERVSPSTIHPIRAVMGGARAISNIEIRAPTTTNAWKRHKSPITNPTNPDRVR